MKILIVEDTTGLRQGLAKVLRLAGYAVDTAENGEEGLWAARENVYDAIVLDIMLPLKNGLEVMEQLRNDGNRVPILLLTARDTVPDRVKGLRAGADDYLIKPFALDELLARIEVLCRRSYASTSGIITVEELTLDTVARRAHVGETELNLTAREFALIEYLARRQGEIVSRTEIETHIYDDQVDPVSNVVDSAIYALRKKLKSAGASPLIHTRRGLGYLLAPSSAQNSTPDEID